MAESAAQVGRPRTFDENDVIDRTVEILWRSGPAGTTMRLLESELGLTQSSLYNAFGSKAKLLSAALDRYLEQIDEALVAPMDGTAPGGTADGDTGRELEPLRGFVDGLVRWAAADGGRGCLLLNAAAADTGGDAGMVARAEAYRQRLRTVFTDVLARVDPGRARARADLVLASAMGLCIAARSGAAPEELESMADGLRLQIEAWSA